MKRVLLRPEVEDDLADAYEWYESKRDGLGQEFLVEYRRAISVVKERPLSIAIAEHGYRPCRLARFPYLIHYDVSGDAVLVVAVLRACRGDSWTKDRG